MICHDLKCIFIHINRNGGKSIENAIWNITPKIGSSEHTTISQYEQRLDKIIFDNYFKFTFCRNPWDRTVSLYHYYKQSMNYYKNKQYIPDEVIRTFENFIEFLNTRNGKIIAPSQLSWIKDLNGNPRIDFVGRLEDYENDWSKVCSKLDIIKELPHLNKSDHKYYKTYYDKKLTKMVEKIYKEDIDFFKYDF